MTGNDLVRSNGSGAERRGTMPNRRSRTAGAQRVRSSDWLDGQSLDSDCPHAWASIRDARTNGLSDLHTKGLVRCFALKGAP